MAVPTGGKEILIVEDDKFLSALLRNRLEREGMSVIIVDDGETAVEILKRQKPDLTILDIILPKKSGFELMSEIKQNPTLESGPVIIMTNLAQEEDVARGKELGAIHYFIKAKTPIEEIVTKVKSTLENASR